MRTFKKVDDYGDFVPAPAGSHFAVCTSIAFLGLHFDKFNDVNIQKVGITYEVEGDDNKKLAVFEEMKDSLHEKSKFYARIVALNGGKVPAEGFELANLLGRGVMVSIVHRTSGERVYANVDQVTPIPRGMVPPVPSVDPVYFDIDDPDPAAFASLNGKHRKMIENRIRTDQPQPAVPAPGMVNLPEDDDIPF